ALIAKEPDLGTAVTLLPVFAAVAFLAGMRMRVLGVLITCVLLTAPVAWKFALKDYQRSRISTFLDPAQDAKGAGYQQIQASFTFQVVYNITMSAGLAPVKGLTLPLMSYGGSSMIATLAGFGLILNVRMRRFTN